MIAALPADRLARYIPVIQLFAARLVLFHQTVAERLGLTATEFKCFRLVEQLGPMPLHTLAREAGLKAGTVSVLVEQLVINGFLIRERDNDDRRRVVLAAVPDAGKRASALYRKQGIAMTKLFANYSDDEFNLILAFLEATSHALERH